MTRTPASGEDRPIPYCLPILDVDFDEVPDLMERQAPSYEYFELWLHTLGGLDPARLVAVLERAPRPVVLLWERGWPERPRLSKSIETRLIDALADLGSPGRHWIDLDLDSQEAAVDRIAAARLPLRLVLSKHDYSATPETPDLEEWISRLDARGADVAKIATYCRSASDAVRLMDLFLVTSPRPRIVIGMGAEGAVTRVWTAGRGSELVYAPVDRTRATAPGQLTRHEIEDALTILRRAETDA